MFLFCGRISSNTRNASRSPLFGVEIEVYVKIKPEFEAAVRERQRTNPSSLPEYWRDWDSDLPNDSGDIRAGAKQLQRVNKAINAIIENVLGPGNGWHCDGDDSLKEKRLRVPPEPRKWWGVEIVSPPMSASKQWQLEIEMVFEDIGKRFDFWTDTFCSCHVHVSPGPTKGTPYTLDQLVRVAKGAFFWESALEDLISNDRHHNEFCKPNYTIFATDEYHAVPERGWGPVFAKIEGAATTPGAEEEDFLIDMQGPWNRPTRYLSSSFWPTDQIGTVEFRRQAGTASAATTIHRILLALTLHISALRYDFDGASNRVDFPRGPELIKELAGCIKRLPETCHGSRFVNFLKWSLESYAGSRIYTEAQINLREEALRKGTPPPHQVSQISQAEQPPQDQGRQASSSSTPTRAPSARDTAPPSQRGEPSNAAPGRQGTAAPSTRASRDARDAAPQRGAGGQGPPRAPAPSGGRGGGGAAGGGARGAGGGRAGGGQQQQQQQQPSTSASAARSPPITTTGGRSGGGGGPPARGGTTLLLLLLLRLWAGARRNLRVGRLRGGGGRRVGVGGLRIPTR
ncbi:uncharacterized protein B0H64DRAFT_451984 [Chaetomium fimeti]|uniref:Uncharacterized protein n=1 Tax=Chaetomium fimeti TaxID=1854472 RepID=A0AAE0H647_9PEZI|nr:hypothetical protein B0H64DRAFT_451984 [Chaetomium fimeti]